MPARPARLPTHWRRQPTDAHRFRIGAPKVLRAGRDAHYGEAYAIRRKEPPVIYDMSAFASRTTAGFVGVFTA